MRMTTKQSATALLAGVTLLWGSVGWANDALNWLNQMQQSVRHLDYSGKLVYSQGKELSIFLIDHSHANGRTNENITVLKTEGGAQKKPFSLVNFNRLQPQGQAYRFDLGGRQNVAGRECQVVVVRPKDKMRYLHRYCIDSQSRLLLKYSLMNRQQQVLEQLVFTDVELSAGAVATRDKTPRQAAPVKPKKPGEVSAVSHAKWRFVSLPLGFKHTQSIPASRQKSTDHLIVSDGMSAVSVFITPRSDQKSYREIKHSAGAVNILTQDLGQYLVTLVGEVPDSTLRAVHKGLRHAQ